MARRTATSGLMSTLASPRTPRRPNSVRAPRLSHTIDDVTIAPDSTVLNGYTLTLGLITASWPMKHSSPTTVPSSTRTCARRSVLRPITQPRRLAWGPTYTWSWQMARSRKASAFTITSVPRTVYGRRCAPDSIRQLSPITTGSSTRAPGLSSTSVPIHRRSPSWKPSISTRTRPSSTSVWARL